MTILSLAGSIDYAQADSILRTIPKHQLGPFVWLLKIEPDRARALADELTLNLPMDSEFEVFIAAVSSDFFHSVEGDGNGLASFLQ